MGVLSVNPTLYKGLTFDPELFYKAAMFHDVGLTEGFRESRLRFEVDGANAARDFLRSHGISEVDIERVWLAIALHTTPEIPHYKRPEVLLVTLGVESDVLGLHYDEFSKEQRSDIVAAHPRTNFKTGIVESFYQGIRDKPETAFGTMNTDILEAKLPGYVKPNFCDYIANNRLAG